MENQNAITQPHSASSKRWGVFQHRALISVFSIGLLLSIISALDLCTSECTGTKSYLLFGFPFAYVGLAFFALAIFLQLYSRKYPFFRSILVAMVAGSLGSEVIFIWLQKYQIGSWCPICLSIAATLAIAGGLFLIGSIIDHQQLGQAMKTIKKVLNSIPIFLCGVFVAFVGISKPDQNLIAMNSMKEKIEFGNVNSSLEVYFISDWFCPSCKKVESVMSKLAPSIMKQARFYFIDFAINPETTNYSPYNLDFLVYNKPNYLKIREALVKLTQTNKSPDDAAIAKAAESVGENLKELSYGEIKGGLSFFDEVATKYKVKSTPTLIIVNTKTNDVKQLKGAKEITEVHVLDAIKALK